MLFKEFRIDIEEFGEMFWNKLSWIDNRCRFELFDPLLNYRINLRSPQIPTH